MKKPFVSAPLLTLITSFLFTTSSLFSQVPDYVPTDGLVGYWPFNGNANDESGNGNHGTVNGNINFVQDRFSNNQNSIFIPGGGPFNNGQGNYIKINNWNYCTENSSRSYVVWTKVLPNQSGTTILSAGVNNNYACNQLWSFNASNTGDCAVQGISVVTNCSQKKYYQNFADGDWHMWTLTYNGANGFSGVQYYFDGELLNTIAGSCTQGEMYSSFQSLAGEMYFGMGNLSNAGSFEGCLDDIAIYSRALTQEEITALYTGTTSTPIAGCTNTTACNYNTAATQDDGSCTFPTQTYLNCAGACLNDANNNGICDEVEANFPSYLPANGLVAWYPFNGNANDESGNGNHGTVNGATLTTDRNGNANSAYGFNGVNNYIEVFDNINMRPTTFTIGLWVNGLDFNGFKQLLSKNAGNSNTESINLVINNNNNWNLTAQVGTPINYGTLLSTSNSINLNSWQYVVYQYDNINNTQSIFLNGILAAANNTSVGVVYDGQSWTIGSQFENGINSYFFNGKIDDIAIYNRALTQEEITALYNGTTNNNSGNNNNTSNTTVPAGISYQAVARNAQGTALDNTAVQVKFTLITDSLSGSTEYVETHSLNTNSLGLFSTAFGTGTTVTGTWAGINWTHSNKYLKVELDAGNGFVDLGTQQLLSSPFAIRAQSAATIENGDLPIFADNAAAIAGGLTVGKLYRTATGDLKVVY